MSCSPSRQPRPAEQVISINGQKKKRIGPDAGPSKGRTIAVEEELLHELGKRYAQYRQAMSDPFDPIAVLALTGKVFEAVNRILASAGHPHELSPTRFGRFRK